MAHRWRYVALGIFVLSLAINNLDRALLAALQKTMLADLHGTNADYGRLVSAFSLPYALGAPVMGLLLDRFGLTVGISLAVALWSGVGFGTSTATSLAGLQNWRAMLGFVESAGIPAAGKAFSQYLPPEERALGAAMNQIGLTLGGVGAPLLAAGLSAAYGWRGSFVCAGLLGLVWLPLWWWTSRRVPPSTTSAQRTAPLPWRTLLPDHRLWALLAANTLLMAGYNVWSNWTTAYLIHDRHLTEAAANRTLAWIPPVFATLGGFAGGWLAWFGAKRFPLAVARFWVLTSFAVLLLCGALIPALPNATWATAGICLSFFATVAMSVNTYAMAPDLFGPGRAAFVISLLTLCYGLMSTFLSPWIGRVVDQQGFAPVCTLIAVLPLCGVGILRLAGLHR